MPQSLHCTVYWICTPSMFNAIFYTLSLSSLSFLYSGLSLTHPAFLPSLFSHFQLLYLRCFPSLLYSFSSPYHLIHPTTFFPLSLSTLALFFSSFHKSLLLSLLPGSYSLSLLSPSHLSLIPRRISFPSGWLPLLFLQSHSFYSLLSFLSLTPLAHFLLLHFLSRVYIVRPLPYSSCPLIISSIHSSYLFPILLRVPFEYTFTFCDSPPSPFLLPFPQLHLPLFLMLSHVSLSFPWPLEVKKNKGAGLDYGNVGNDMYDSSHWQRDWRGKQGEGREDGRIRWKCQRWRKMERGQKSIEKERRKEERKRERLDGEAKDKEINKTGNQQGEEWDGEEEWRKREWSRKRLEK